MSERTHNIVDWIGLALLVGLAAIIYVRWSGQGGAAPVAVGTPMPPLSAAKWLNVADGAAPAFEGQIVVVDCWATWCGPCRAEMPNLALIVGQYRPLGVEFLGVTSETEADLHHIQQFIAQTPGFDWPVAYGAFEFMRELDIKVIPTVVLFGRDGRALWSGVGSHGLEKALDEALAADGRLSGVSDDGDPAGEGATQYLDAGVR